MMAQQHTDELVTQSRMVGQRMWDKSVNVGHSEMRRYLGQFVIHNNSMNCLIFAKKRVFKNMKKNNFLCRSPGTKNLPYRDTELCQPSKNVDSQTIRTYPGIISRTFEAYRQIKTWQLGWNRSPLCLPLREQLINTTASRTVRILDCRATTDP